MVTSLTGYVITKSGEIVSRANLVDFNECDRLSMVRVITNIQYDGGRCNIVIVLFTKGSERE